MRLTTKENGKAAVPIVACRLAGGDAVRLELSGESEQPGGERDRFRMVVNTGKPILNHWLWGNLGIDHSGVEYKQRLPALKDHDPNARAGFSEKIELSDEGIVAEGVLLKSSETAKEILSDAADGFPWQASTLLLPSRLQALDEGEEADVNGHTITGPGTIFRESVMREITFTALGADDDTSVEMSAHEGEVEAVLFSLNSDTEPEPMTEPQTPPADLDSVRNEAILAERNRAQTIREAAEPEQAELATQCIDAGDDVETALAKLNADLRKRFRAAAVEFEQSGDLPQGGGNSADPEPDAEAAALAALPEGAEKWAKLWEADENIRQEFAGNEKKYFAWKRNEHRNKHFARRK
jgi:hypothetical protein